MNYKLTEFTNVWRFSSVYAEITKIAKTNSSALSFATATSTAIFLKNVILDKKLCVFSKSQCKLVFSEDSMQRYHQKPQISMKIWPKIDFFFCCYCYVYFYKVDVAEGFVFARFTFQQI